MDGTHFDELARALASPRSRRGLLGALTASVAAAWTGARGAAAPKPDKPTKCYGGGSQCTNGKQCCSGICTNRRCGPETSPGCTPATCPGTDTACQTRACIGGACGFSFAPAGTECPTGACDGNGNCVPGTSCSDEDEGAPCQVGTGACLGTGIMVCGADGSLVCNAVEGAPSAEICNGIDDDCDGEVDEGALCPDVANAVGTCQDGSCTFTCNAGFADCNGDPSDGCEINTATDVNHCGSCHNPCGADQTCVNGHCTDNPVTAPV